MSAVLAGFLTYALPWESFTRVDPEEFIDIVAIGDGDAVTKSPHRPDFERRLRIYSEAMQVLGLRYQLYMDLLQGDVDVHARHGAAVGDVDQAKRLLFAMHNCYTRGKEILRLYNDLLGNAPEYLIRGPTHLLSSDNDCRATQVCLCNGAVPPFIRSCLPADATVLMPVRAVGKAPASGRASQADIDALFG
ncbi:MAG TPA: hypothetical protein VF678_14690 [bacterium]